MQIHELTPKTSLASTDVIALDTGSVTNKITGANLAASLKTIGSLVTGVKGNAESSYRTGQVNITPANVGALPVAGGTMEGLLNMGQSGSSTSAQPIQWRTADDTLYQLSTYNNVLRITKTISGTTTVVLSIASDGTVTIPNPADWRTALNISPTTVGVVLATGSQSFSNVASGAATSQNISASIGTTNYTLILESNLSSCIVGAQSKTANGFNLLCRNVSTSTASPTVTWTAIARS
jgi:hypothetical protein